MSVAPFSKTLAFKKAQRYSRMQAHLVLDQTRAHPIDMIYDGAEPRETAVHNPLRIEIPEYVEPLERYVGPSNSPIPFAQVLDSIYESDSESDPEVQAEPEVEETNQVGSIYLADSGIESFYPAPPEVVVAPVVEEAPRARLNMFDVLRMAKNKSFSDRIASIRIDSTSTPNV